MHERRPGVVPMSLAGVGTSRFARGWLAALAGAIAIALTFGALIGFGTGEANAATPGVSTTVTLGGETYQGTPVVNEGQTLTMKVQYDQAVGAGATVRIDLGANVTLGPVPAGNLAVESITKDPNYSNAVLVKFKDPWPAGIGQGVFDLNFTVNSVTGSSKETIAWTVDGDPHILEVIIKNDGDEVANVNDYQNKSISNNGNLGQFVSYDAATGKVTVAPGIIGAPISYVLDVDTKAAKPGFTIADALPAGMTYKADSFAAEQTTWDTNGLNKTTSPVSFAPQISDNTFEGSLDLPASSKTEITYTASIADEAARAALEAQLQVQADKVSKVNGGNFTVNLKNTAIFGGATTKDASVSFGGKVPGLGGPNLGNALKKTSDWSTKEITPQEDGTLDPPVDITYTLTTDLTPFDGSNVLKTLTNNVVLSDNLPVQASWNTADAAFLTSTGITLEKIAPVAVNLFTADAYVGKYFVDGQKLYVNVGMDKTLKSTIVLKAQITTTEALADQWTSIPGETKKKFTNRGEWTYTTSEGTKKDGYNSEVVLLSHVESEDGFNAPDYFKKDSTTKQLTVNPGETATVGYTFTVGQGKGIDMTKSSIVDYVDSNVFDTTDLAAIKAALTATYDWQSNILDASSFDVSLNDAGDLVIKLNDAGIAAVNARGKDKQFVLNIGLTTKPIVGKQTLQIANKATLFGADEKALFWSEVSSSATSYGDEAEIRKEVRDTPNTAWTQNLRAEMDAEGNLVQDTFVYNVALVPHGKYTGVKIFDVVDELPAGIQFLGFVDDANIDDGANPKAGPVDLKGNVVGTFVPATADAPQGKVVLSQKPGTVLDASQGEASANVLVRITNFTADVAIVNSIGTKSASITPSDGYPLSISKVDSKDDEKVINDPASRFQILDADDKVVVDNVFVQDGALRVKDAQGAVKNVKVSAVGSYKVKEVTPPKGYELNPETIAVTVGADGSSDAVKFFNTPAKTYAVGDFVWVDANKNGLQDDAEVLEGVKVTLLDGAGMPVATTETDSAGRYMFDELLAGDYQVKFELTEAQSAIYDFTTPNAPAGTDDADDSDADPATGLTVKFTLDDTNAALTKEYRFDFAATEGIDPRWDAGVILKPSVSVGDYVWVDSSRDGIQDAGEPGIKDVVLTITGPDGKPVTDVFGEPVGPKSTDEDGAYTIENLPVLEEGKSYTVSIDQDASKAPLAPYVPTIDTGADRATNSSTWTATSTGLTKDGDRDPTLDFGFVLPKVSVGDYVWVDSSRDGIQDAGEPGIKDVVLTITGPDGKPVTDVFGEPVGPKSTDENGAYTFENLPVLEEGKSYTVSIDRDASAEPLAPYIPTITTEGNPAKDSSTWTATSTGLTKDGDRDPTLDFGFVLPKVSVGDYVWVDSNRDGIQDAGEPGIKDVVLTITGPDGKPVTDVFGEPVGPKSTDENGAYTFENLPVLEEGKSYTVSIDQDASKAPLAPYVPTITTEGNPAKDSSTWTATSTGLTKDGDRDPTLDFGFVLPKVSVGDYVWVDSNRDGIQDAGEPGIKDVVLTITGPDGKPVTDVFGNEVKPVTTDEKGAYTFVNLPVLTDGESYTVSIDRDASATPLAPYIPTITTEGNPEKDSSTWTATSTGLTKDGDRDPTLDFGFVLPKVSVGDYVWVDSNRDGIQDEGEKGIKDVVLTITGPDGKPVTDVFGNEVKPVTTDENGAYTFENLPVLEEGKAYTVSIDKDGSKEALAPYIPTVETEGNREGDSSTWTATSEGLTKDGDRDPTLDFGFVLPKVSVGDYVWVDNNGNGRQDPGEPGIKDVVLTITGPDGKPVTDVFGKIVGSVSTDKDGAYNFANLPVLKDGESYTVSINRKASEKALAPYQPTKAGEGDRIGDSSTWTATSEGLVKDGDRDSTLDFGFVLIPDAPAPTTPPASTPAPTTPAATDDLSNTGFDGAVLMAMGLLLTLLGGGAVVLTGRRRRSSTASH